jgi:hypothetical protein
VILLSFRFVSFVFACLWFEGFSFVHLVCLHNSLYGHLVLCPFWNHHLHVYYWVLFVFEHVQFAHVARYGTCNGTCNSCDCICSYVLGHLAYTIIGQYFLISSSKFQSRGILEVVTKWRGLILMCLEHVSAL